MDIYECERKAKDIGYNTAKFTAQFPAGEFECQWIDAYMGLFKVDADGMRDGFCTVRDFAEQFPTAEYSNLRVEA